MIAFLSLFIHVLVSPLKIRARLEAEIVLIRHQLNVLRRRAPSKPKLTTADRMIFVWLYRLFPSVKSAITIVRSDLSSGGIGRVSDCIGAGSLDLKAVGQRFQ